MNIHLNVNEHKKQAIFKHLFLECKVEKSFKYECHETNNVQCIWYGKETELKLGYNFGYVEQNSPKFRDTDILLKQYFGKDTLP